MPQSSFFTDTSNIVGLLKTCAKQRDLQKGSKIHAYIQKQKLLKKNIYLANTLVSMYARCGALEKAQQVHNELPARNVITWNTLIGGYTQHGYAPEALRCFESMQHEGHSPDSITFSCALKACGSMGSLEKGEQIHDKILSLGLLRKDVVLGTALIDMYARCGALTKAQQAVTEFLVRDAIMWTALIAGYVQQGYPEEALKCFDSMQQDGHSPDAVTLTCALKACGSIGAVAKGEQIHDKIVDLGLLEKDIILGNSLVDMYARCGALAKAQQVLEELFVRDVVTWNALIAGYTQQGYSEEALNCFEFMQRDGHCPNIVTFICVLKACGCLGAAAKGELIHSNIVSLGLLRKDVVIGNALFDMYVKCAVLAKAVELLDELPFHGVVTWNVLIGGYGQQGQSVEALDCFERMQSKGVRPDPTTLLCVLNACSHSGLLYRAKMYFSRMSTMYGITANLEHYCCMVDLLGRAGEFDEALGMIEKMPSTDYLEVWHALMGACRQWGDFKIGKLAFEYALHLHKNSVAMYVCMVNIYTAAGMKEDAAKIEVMRIVNGINVNKFLTQLSQYGDGDPICDE